MRQQADPRRRRGRRVLRDAVVLALVLGGLAFLVFRPSREVAEARRDCDPPAEILLAGAKLPTSCKVKPFDGGDLVTLAELQGGKPLVLNFWASWCLPCIKEIPEFQQVYAAAGGRVALIGVDLVGTLFDKGGETEYAGRQFAQRLGATYPLAFDHGWLLYQHFNKRPIPPATIFVEPDGTIAYVQGGPLSAQQLTEAIRTHLGVDLGAGGGA